MHTFQSSASDCILQVALLEVARVECSGGLCSQVSMGPPERGLEFAELTEFPPELLLADPENVTYDKLELKNTGPIATFFDPRVGRWLQ